MGGATFGERVYRARLALQAKLGREVTQAEIGERLGVSGQAVSLWEQDRSQPKLDVIERLAAVLETEPAALAFGVRSGEKNGNHHATPSNGVNHGRTVERPREAYEGPHRDETLRERLDRKKGKPRKQA